MFKKKSENIKEPQYYMSQTNMQVLNYKVYYLNTKEKILYFSIAFIVGAIVGYLFYGGIGLNEYGEATSLTNTLNILIPSITGLVAAKLYLPLKTKSIIEKRNIVLRKQFRDMLEAINTSLGSGKNVTDSFIAVYEDLKIQYDEGEYILKELEVIINCLNNNIDIEQTLEDFGNRSGNEDIISFAQVFKISYRKGANIKEVVRNTHSILNEKLDILEEIDTMFAASKMEQNIMLFMPIVLIGFIKSMSPELSANFVTGTGLVSTTLSIIIFIIAYAIGRVVLKIKI